jgi:UDP-N-acetylglucosamine 4,6-dehydratase
MITKEDAPFTVEFDDFYIILPQININGVWEHYKDAKRVPPTFEYNSGSNDWWLTIPEMRKLISEL